jgi:hypothetical protein
VLKFRVLWAVAPCSHVEVDRRFKGAYCLHHQGADHCLWKSCFGNIPSKMRTFWMNYCCIKALIKHNFKSFGSIQIHNGPLFVFISFFSHFIFFRLLTYSSFSTLLRCTHSVTWLNVTHLQLIAKLHAEVKQVALRKSCNKIRRWAILNSFCLVSYVSLLLLCQSYAEPNLRQCKK